MKRSIVYLLLTYSYVENMQINDRHHLHERSFISGVTYSPNNRLFFLGTFSSFIMNDHGALICKRTTLEFR